MSILKQIMKFVKEDKSEEKTWSQLAKKWLNYLIISLILVGLGAAYVYLFKEPTTIICKF
jgi:Sec-independent protein secretion pathway component TatC